VESFHWGFNCISYFFYLGYLHYKVDYDPEEAATHIDLDHFASMKTGDSFSITHHRNLPPLYMAVDFSLISFQTF